MKRFLFVLAFISAAAPAMAARRRAVIHPPSLGPCTPGIVEYGYLSNDVAVDANNVFFSDDQGDLFRAPKDGTNATLVCEVPEGDMALLAQDDQNLYFFGDMQVAGVISGSLYSVPKSGGTPVQLAANVPLPFDLRVDATSVYWTSLGTTPDLVTLNSDGKVEKVNKDGSGHVVLASNLSGAAGLAVDDTNVWFGETGIASGNPSSGLRRVPKNGGAVTKVTNGQLVASIDVTATDVWYATGDVNSSNGALLRLPKSGGTPVTVTSGSTTPIAIHIAGDKVYYIASGDTDETITSIPLAGGPPASLKMVDFWSEALALDDCSVYYPSTTGIERIGR